MNITRARRFRATAISLAVFATCWPMMPPMASCQAASLTRDEMFAKMTVRAPDAFYDPPAQLPHKPGALLQSEPLNGVTLPAGMRGWRILYTTMVDDNTPATAVATVFSPIRLSGGPRPVIMWEHGTTGLVQKCMPSLVSMPTMGIPAIDRVLRAGWVIVATDYSFAEKNGPLPYLIGEGEARSGLDSVRAARQMPELRLDNRTVVWGHSQGGHSALWTGIVGPHYAPDVNVLGVTAIAPAANITNILRMNPLLDKRLGSWLAGAYSRFYPDIKFEQAVRPEALVTAREVQGLCPFFPAEDAERLGKLTQSFDGGVLATSTNQALANRLAQNTPDHTIEAPLLIAQGLADFVVPPAATDAFVTERCAAGQGLDYWTFTATNHSTIVANASFVRQLVAWTAARFANKPQATGCTRKTY